MAPEHIVKAYDDELKHLNDIVARMGGLAEKQLTDAVEAVIERDVDLAGRVVEADQRVDALEGEVDDFVVRLLALRQPMARDLREIVAALRISADIERIADYATNVAKRAIALAQVPTVRPVHAVPRMARMAQMLIKDAIDAYVERDAQKAVRVWQSDEALDEMYTSLFRELLTYMMEDPRNITPSTHLLFIAKNIERIGDHATNVAENVYFLVHGTPLPGARPKGDTSSLAVVEPTPRQRAARKQPDAGE
jgi:phosphate transport system protein